MGSGTKGEVEIDEDIRKMKVFKGLLFHGKTFKCSRRVEVLDVWLEKVGKRLTTERTTVIVIP